MAKLDTDLCTRFFMGGVRELQVCNICNSSSHTAVSCPLKLHNNLYRRQANQTLAPHEAIKSARCGLPIYVQNLMQRVSASSKTSASTGIAAVTVEADIWQKAARMAPTKQDHLWEETLPKLCNFANKRKHDTKLLHHKLPSSHYYLLSPCTTLQPLS